MKKIPYSVPATLSVAAIGYGLGKFFFDTIVELFNECNSMFLALSFIYYFFALACVYIWTFLMSMVIVFFWRSNVKEEKPSTFGKLVVTIMTAVAAIGAFGVTNAAFALITGYLTIAQLFFVPPFTLIMTIIVWSIIVAIVSPCNLGYHPIKVLWELVDSYGTNNSKTSIHPTGKIIRQNNENIIKKLR
ncbi:hypothetical protein [Janthinobacterium sp. NKUCC06_STL]|uniref:hypothetical protein n=1 Tax=Janthinobacterium sp. NKUCC06_STL TaxID=2842127 RepID=UPI001C5B359A|nr:hypothetical protein [Janthinobacterium sp. NKUCC06_STL]MBW3512020.1 hypothetical protein [Janthinobacterium sp. NKUCC06_STL]